MSGHQDHETAGRPRSAWLRALSSFISFLLGTGVGAAVFGYAWANGTGTELCGRFGWLRVVCPQQWDQVTDAQARYWVSRVVAAMDSPSPPADVYDRWMKPGVGSSVTDDKGRFEAAIARVEAMQQVSPARRRGHSNTFTFDVQTWRTVEPYRFDRLYSSHENAVYKWTVRVHLTAGPGDDEDVWGSAPSFETTGNLQTHDAPVFEFTARGKYFDSYDSSEPRVSHPGPKNKHRQLTAICYWPVNAVRGHRVTDPGHLMVKTYVGWVHYAETSLSEGGWPKDLIACASGE